MAQADPATISNKISHDAIPFAQNGCNFGWVTQVFRCVAGHGKSSPMMAGAHVEVQPDELLLASNLQWQAAFDAVS